MTSMRLTADDARRLLFATQCLPAAADSAIEAATRGGFLRTLGGADVYVALRARVPGLRRADVDRLVAAGDLQVVPAVRGCMYLVPRVEVPWALRTADLLSRARRQREQEKAGIKKAELAKLSGAVLEALTAHGPQSPNALRALLPKGAVRSLGEAGKKLGISSALPSALRELEFQGRIARAVEDGRLDNERYLWRVAERDPFASVDLPEEPAGIHAHLARLYLAYAGLGTADAFAAWAGIGKRDAKAALARVAPVAVLVEGLEGERCAPAPLRQRPAMTAVPPASADFAFLPFEDNLIHLQGGPRDLVPTEHHGIAVPSWGRSETASLGEARHMSFRSIARDGRIVGFWEYDPDAKSVVSAPFDRLPPAQRRALDAEAEALGRFLSEEIGHGRSFSLDTDDDLRRRCTSLRDRSS